jgi:protocatechuate 3,4-dioxygenase, alpha subunit
VSHLGRYDLYEGQTPGQTVGPFFGQGLVRVRSNFQLPALCPEERDVIGPVLVNEGTRGERLRIEGRVFDGLQRPIPDALIEIWQADADGRYAHPLQPGEPQRGAIFQGFGRCPSNDAGQFVFETVRPGAVLGPGGRPQAPHINVILGARGMARLAFTRLYFADDPALAGDAVLALVPEARRSTLLAKRVAEVPLTYRLDLHLQGERETVFFDF